jgi:hypothetical protein
VERKIAMTEGKSQQDIREKYPTLEFKDFLENSPAHKIVIARGFWHKTGNLENYERPEILLPCENEKCQGHRLFESFGSGYIYTSHPFELFLSYKCKHCEITKKYFSLWVFGLLEDKAGLILKIGELPPFGEKTPPRLLRLLGPDKDLFLRGRRAELHGLGIGAFTYYRRVVENQKNILLDEIIKVVQKVEASPETFIAELTKAKDKFQFTDAIDDVKLAIPQVLFIEGRNPLLLLHGVLSSGIHGKSDEECLELSKSIRLVLTGLVERLDLALSQKKELSDAVSKLLQAKTGKGKTEGK